MGRHGRFGGAGFTLIELMVVVAVVVVLQTLAAPALSGMVNSMRMTAAANSLFSSLFFARNEAIKRNSRVVVCKSATGSACAGSGGWEQGWIVFHDVNNNAALDAGETLLSREQTLPDPIRLTGNNPVVSYVSYTPMGTTSYISGAFQAGTLTVCQQSATPVDARLIVISSAGRPRTVKTTVGYCPL
jgi:type IV fimbrial biogenesis protein FimT